MRTLTGAAAAAVALATGTLTLCAQWPSYPSDGPRTPEGKIDLMGCMKSNDARQIDAVPEHPF